VAKKFDIQTEPPPPVPTFNEAADAFIARRKAPDADGKPMRRSWRYDKARLEKYLRPPFGKKHLDELHEGDMRQLIDELRKVLKPQSIRNCLAIVSRIYNEQPKSLHLDNPVAGLDRADRDSIGPAWDPRLTPWLRADQVRAAYLAMPEMSREAPWRAMFAVGTFAGLRTGEVLALEWADVDFQARTIHVRRSVEGPLKDDESRIAPLPDTLAAVLTEWRKIAPVGVTQAFPSTGHGGRRRKDGHTYVKPQSLSAGLKAALAQVNADRKDGKLPAVKWYEATALLRLQVRPGRRLADEAGEHPGSQRDGGNAPLCPPPARQLQRAGARPGRRAAGAGQGGRDGGPNGVTRCPTSAHHVGRGATTCRRCSKVVI